MVPLVALFQHFCHHRLSILSPFLAIFECIVQILVAGFAKDCAFVKLFGQGNNVVIKETKFTFVPKSGGVLCSTSVDPRLVTFLEETLVPFDVDMPEA